MENAARQALCDLTARHGAALSADIRRVEGLLRDHCGAHRREINILINALEEHVAHDLLQANRRMPLELLLANLEKRLESNLAVTPDAARWAVNSWALALGVATAEEIRRREQSPTSESNLVKNQTAQQREDFDQSRFEPQKREPDKQAAPTRPPVFKNPPPAPTTNPFPATTNSSLAPRGTNQNSPIAPINSPNAATKQTHAPIAPNPPPVQHPRRRWFSFRGCFVGCFLLLIVLSILFVGAPYAIKVMREAQQTSQPRFPR